MNRKYLYITGIILGFVLAVIFLFAPFRHIVYRSTTRVFGTAGHILTNRFSFINSFRKSIFGSLFESNDSDNNSGLSIKGIIELTNKERRRYNRLSLTENQKLDTSAQMKLNDLFKKQYFDHISPDGHGPAYLAGAVGYEYIIIGENLALGFSTNSALMTAWENSKGHEANIINGKYTEIGVAVGQEMYQGTMTWIAVQEFGEPGSDCPHTDGLLYTHIQNDKTKINYLKTNLDMLQKEIMKAENDQSQNQNTSSEEQAALQRTIASYNTLVKSYNKLAQFIQIEVSTYNQGVHNYNVCIGAQ